jgi:hypothetical protein
MVSEIEHDGETVYLCDVCGFGYRDHETAEQCEDNCSKFHSCSIEITAKAVYYPEKPEIKNIDNST